MLRVAYHEVTEMSSLTAQLSTGESGPSQQGDMTLARFDFRAEFRYKGFIARL